MNDLQQVVIPAPDLRGAILELAQATEVECGIDGPAGTGKTYGILYYIHVLLLNYPGAKFLVARKYNTDLAGSAMATYRDHILDPREGVYYFGGNKVEAAAYRYPNGSLLVVNGLDKPGKVKSMEFDGIYINEATECSAEDIEFCRMRLARRGKCALPNQKLIMDFNPDAPTHHLNQRMNEGKTRRILSRHEDNPAFWDAKTQDWTEAGRHYIFNILGGLTGVRLARYRYGIWAAAEGTVYQDSWDRSRNVIKPFPIPREWPRYLAIDFGFTHPFVCLWGATDPDGRLHIYRQIYMSKRLVEDHAKDIAIASGWFHLLPKTHPKYNVKPADNADPLPRDIICDHDAEDRATLERHLGLRTRAAKKTVSDGIQAVSSRFRPAGDGKPRLMIHEHCLVERDQELVTAKKTTCLEQEPDTYRWDLRQGMKQGEHPVKELDDGLDALRYLCAYHDLTDTAVTYFPNLWR